MYSRSWVTRLRVLSLNETPVGRVAVLESDTVSDSFGTGIASVLIALGGVFLMLS